MGECYDWAYWQKPHRGAHRRGPDIYILAHSPQWSSDMRFGRAVGDGSLILLYMGLAMGPISRFWPRAGMLLPYRRELGIWFGVFAILHTIIILDGWVLWDFY